MVPNVHTWNVFCLSFSVEGLVRLLWFPFMSGRFGFEELRSFFRGVRVYIKL